MSFARPYFRTRQIAAHTGGVSFTPSTLASLYGFPKGYDGTGQTVGIVSLGGGFSQSVLDWYFGQLNIKRAPVEFVSVDGAKNTPGEDADVENYLDIAVIGAIAPGAHIQLIKAPNTDTGYVDIYKRARANKCDILSSSWGAPETQWTATVINAMNAEMKLCLDEKMVLPGAAGDNGYTDGTGTAAVDFPASSPYITSIGGTSTLAGGGKILSESVWNNGNGGGATGGGISNLFNKPEFQKNVPIPLGNNKRGVPDFAFNADPETGVQIPVGPGKVQVTGGTSAGSPMMAALAAILNQALGRRIGPLNPLLYSLPASCFVDVVKGDNGSPVFKALQGFDCVTGRGRPIGDAILAALQGGGVVPPTPPPPGAITVVIPQAGTYTLTKTP